MSLFIAGKVINAYMKHVIYCVCPNIPSWGSKFLSSEEMLVSLAEKTFPHPLKPPRVAVCLRVDYVMSVLLFRIGPWMFVLTHAHH